MLGKWGRRESEEGDKVMIVHRYLARAVVMREGIMIYGNEKIVNT